MVAGHFGTRLAHDQIDDADRFEGRDFTEVEVLVRARLYPDSDHDHLKCAYRPAARVRAVRSARTVRLLRVAARHPVMAC